MRPVSALTLGREPTGVLKQRAWDWLSQNSGPFHRLPAGVADELLRLARFRLVLRDTVLAPQGEPAPALWAITQGTIVERVHSRGLAREIVRYQAGDVAGALTGLDQAPLPFELVAAEPTEVLEFDARALAQLRAALHPAALALQAALIPEAVAHLTLLHGRMRRLAAFKRSDALPLQHKLWR